MDSRTVEVMLRKDAGEHVADTELALPSFHKADWDIHCPLETPEQLTHKHCQAP